MLLRNRRKLFSLCIAAICVGVVYLALTGGERTFFANEVLRRKGPQDSTVSAVAAVAEKVKESTQNKDMDKETEKKNKKKKKKSKATSPQDTKKFSGIMPSMPDQQAKEELGRASWKYFHTLLARYPDHPTPQERKKLEEFIRLYAELYPCGECSYHFVKMLEKYPPQTSSRLVAAMWGCHVHNVVNEYLKKDIYDCSTILEDYDCGCGDDPVPDEDTAISAR
ncbi:uncharacterized protein KNAG_0D01470 [Huiozyma naganishii CBS 8797]|uniref:Sulfhydryl oxidase n=1 Tax=Huiozyma naganishii (strain ATCC MYA-139 / BCRC 22969 / CBS 8797 / KCTC 17520 / NBRC 10181 / NCYC 3082 / Yp74L-3) TaxID=1071383 RepID=J7S5L1_HUIN7|nr:hypothetical protein KNAG_0D01470 [Kazachstania naganishii CBS 8797]CCK69899.1 hypothetical protein KNAG_0D01470 [Kazachstania naganishii CBS 8797]